MKKTSFGILVGTIVGLLIIALFIFVHISLNRLDKKVITLQQESYENSVQVSQIVNFFNSVQNQSNE